MSDLLSRARDAEDLDCPSRDCGSICQGELIREMADEIELLKAEIERLTELNKEAEEQLCAIAKEFCGDARNCEQHPKTLAGFVVQEVGKVRAEIERLRALLEGYEAMEKYMKHEAMK
jgi:uncharacterized small protein (DUF1192 family)